MRLDSYCEHEELNELVDVMLNDDPAPPPRSTGLGYPIACLKRGKRP